MSFYRSIITHDIILNLFRASVVTAMVGFFVVAASLFVFALTDIQAISIISSGIIWVCALLASLLAVDSMYQDDYDDGTLEQLYLSGHMIEHLILAKMIAYWCITALPMLAAAPLLILMLGADMSLLPALAMGTIALSVITSMGAALTLQARRAKSVIGLLILPLYIPIIIFGVQLQYGMLFALVLLCLPLSVISSRYALLAAIKQ